jgi:hypothetical protein
MNFLDSIQPIASLIISVATLIGIVIAVYKYSADPDIKNKTDIKEIELQCQFKHQRIDEVIQEIRGRYESIDKSIMLIKENDLKHIENNVRDIKNTQTKILTILEMKSIDKTD